SDLVQADVPHLPGEPGPAADQAAVGDDARAHAHVAGDVDEVDDAATGQPGRFREGRELRVVLQAERRMIRSEAGGELRAEGDIGPAQVRGEAHGRTLVVDRAGRGDGDARDPEALTRGGTEGGGQLLRDTVEHQA